MFGMTAEGLKERQFYGFERIGFYSRKLDR